MKIVKKILLVLVIIIAIPLIAAIFMKKEYTVVREIAISKPKQEVFSYIRMLKYQNKYSKWVMTDPNAKMTYTGTDGTVGFVSAWDSDNKEVGKGSQTITKIVEGERMNLDLHFIKPFEGKADAWMTTEGDSSQTKVKWAFHGTMPYPMNIMMVFCDMDKMLGSDIATSLSNLKGVLEH